MCVIGGRLNQPTLLPYAVFVHNTDIPQMTVSKTRETSGTQGREGVFPWEVSRKIVSDFDQQIPQSQTADKQMPPQHQSNPPEIPRDGPVNDCVNCDEDLGHVSYSNFLYVHAQFPNCNISAMLDAGSLIKLMSKKWYDVLFDRVKSKLIPVTDDNIVLANNQQIKITGFSHVY